MKKPMNGDCFFSDKPEKSTSGRRSGFPRYLPGSVVLGLGLLFLFMQAFFPDGEVLAQPEPDTGRKAFIVTIEGAIGPATASYVTEAFKTARDQNGKVILLLLSTPGGLDQSMRTIIREILGSSIPVAGYVFPSGARAASAGTYILYACHVAAMAPGTNLGAATPVQIGGGGGLPGGGKEEESEKDKKAPKSDSDAMTAKAVNDAVAFIRSLAQLRNRNADWAEKAVRESVSLPVDEALEIKVIDMTAVGVHDLLQKMDGMRVTVENREVTLQTRNLTTRTIEPGWRNKILSVITDPNIALILMMIGIYGLIFEFANPGAIGPGVVGAVCLLFGMYALNVLPLNYAGLGLLLLGIALMTAEAFVPSFGILGIGGIISFMLGSAMLVEGDAPGFGISWKVIAGTAATSVGLLVFLLGYIWKAHRRPVRTGSEMMIGSEAVVLKWSGKDGYVHVHGERWRAKGPAGIEVDDRVKVRKIQDLVLTVEPIDNSEKGENP